MVNYTAPCSVADQNVFGPQVAASCLHGFDFTLLFEDSILTILPLGIALILVPLRIRALVKTDEKVQRSWLYVSKGVALSIYVILQIVLLALWGSLNLPKSKATIAATALTLIGFVSFIYLSHLEHIRSVRPSTLLNVYLGFSALLDIARVRTLWYMPGNLAVAAITSSSFGLKLLILLLEAKEKRALLKRPYENSAPESTGGIFNRSTFWWLKDLFWRGFKSLLTVDTLLPLDEEIISASDTHSIAQRWNKADKSGPNALLWTFAIHFKWQLLAGVYPRLAYTAFNFAQPFLVQRVLDFIDEPKHINSSNIAYGLIGAYALVYFGISFSYALYEHKTYRVITMIRGSLLPMIFDKTLQVSASAVSDAEAVTLMSADIERIGSGLREMHEMYSSVIELALALWLLERLLGVAMAASTVFVVLCLIAGMPIAVAAGNAQGQWLEAIEKRIAVTSKVLGGMKGIKMTGLVRPISENVARLRELEIRASGLFRLYTVFVLTLSYASSALAPVFGFGLYILLARAHSTTTLTNGIAFSALTLFSLLDKPMVALVDGVEELMTVVNCFQRIQSHLLEEERVDCREIPGGASSTTSASIDEKDEGTNTEKKSLPTVQLQSLLDNQDICAVVRDASAGWSSDEPSLLTNLNFEIRRGKTTMLVGPVGCGKSTLLKMLIGELPEVSGSVATSYRNAAYCYQSPWITFGTIQQNILGGSIWNKPWYDTVVQACALDTDIQDFPDGDQTKVGTRGSRLSGGQQIRVALARALYSKEPVMILDDVLTGLDRTTELFVLRSVFGEQGLIKAAQTTVVLATNTPRHLSCADYIMVLDNNGHLVEQGSSDEISGQSAYVKNLSTQPLATSTSRAPEVELTDETLQELNLSDEETHESDRQTGDITVYLYYFHAVGPTFMVLLIFSCMVFVFGLTFPQVWLQWWTEANEKHPNERIGYWLGVYGGLGGLTMFATFGGNWLFSMRIVPKTARRFHDLLLTTTMGATTSFLTSTDLGNTINRFSQDLELIDMELPEAFQSTIIAGLSCIAEGVLVFVGSSYVAACIPVCIIVVYFVQNFYLRTSRQLRFLDIEAKAPLFSQFLEALSGLPTIRSYGWGAEYQRRNKIALDASQKPYYLMFCIQRWLNLVLDLLVACIATLVVAVATTLKGKVSSSFLGVALFSIVSFSGSLQQLITEWTLLETAIGAVSRIRAYVVRTQPEDQVSETDDIPEHWPKDGQVQFHNVSASYQSSSEPVLKDINLLIEPGQKIALCGRTGSGKSSLVSTVLRMLDLDKGSITIDGVDISKISRYEIRSRLNTLPQEPFFLHGDVRLNMDPRGSETDEKIIDALKSVRLWDFIEAKGGLDMELSEDILSHGQRQLFCLARATCKTSSILIMDEATSSVDSETDELMQQVIRSKFEDQTIIAIAHKLHTILDFDKVAILDKGRVVEFDAPQALLVREGSAFKRLFESSARSDRSSENGSDE
ncbi:Cyclic peptide transporter [Venustampulla echinocandica]|uniref:Cyclic peptide transporter n=1 Tax=Venustampulla echinocandica TaxID=2656787 RepID=A0A370U1S4_9HELO|nr:Cyclic peptide transporter [Venustampulla echinocandica]RDL41711.1 Cyclic peptide transporter [Venustampulla echinocandica]